MAWRTPMETQFLYLLCCPGKRVRRECEIEKEEINLGPNCLEVTAPAKERGKQSALTFKNGGGCHYQHIPASGAVEALEERYFARNAFRGSAESPGMARLWNIPPSHTATGTRAQWAVRKRMPRALEYFLPESSVIVPIDECPVTLARLAHTFAQLQEMARSGRLPEGIQEIEAFAESADDKIALNVAFEKFPKPAAGLACAFREALARD